MDDRELAELLGRGGEVARRITDAFRRGGAQRRSFPTKAGPSGGADPDRASRKTRTLQAAVHLAEDLHRLEARADGEVAWVDGTRRNVRLRLSPIDVGPVLATMLWGEVTSVLTSATIPPRIVERVGLQAFPTEELNVGSPFDYRSHALLYVARHLPDRRADGAEEAIHEELAQLLEAAGGRTLALFTSKRATEAAAAALAAELPYTLLLQGDLPKDLLLEKFATDETSCLFATMGFWQGVDIPGRALSLVTIDKLPFPRPDDPLLQARRDRAGGGPSRWSTCRGRRRCWPKVRGGSCATRRTAAWWPCSTPGWPRRRTVVCCWRPCRPCAARWTSTRWNRSCGGRLDEEPAS